MITLRATVVIPAYNQYESLQKVLFSLMRQTVSAEHFQVIVVDDGSSDGLAVETSRSLTSKYKLDICLLHQNNRGRAAARNAGIACSKHEVIIFCDADRVPSVDFVESHLKMQEASSSIVIGYQYEIFHKKIDEFFSKEIDWLNIKRFSKVPNFFGRISKIYEGKNCLAPNLCWMSLLIGNVSIRKGLINEVGGFDEDFTDWGFEHFELGLRLQKLGHKFEISLSAANYHIPHLRENNFYSKKIEESAQIISIKHPEINIETMQLLLMMNVDVIQFNTKIFKDDYK